MSDVLLQAERICTGYQESKKASKIIGQNLSISLSEGKFVCLLGTNGSGKSTLLRTIAGLQKPVSGTIDLDGKTIESWTLRERAQRISLVLTEKNLPAPFKVQELVALGRHPHNHSWKNLWGEFSSKDQEIVEWALRITGIWKLRNKDVHSVSDGEAQKAMIARALAQQTPILILDEPAIFLDLPYRMELFTLLRHLAEEEGIAVLCSCHDLDLAFQYAHEFWMLCAQGECVTGKPDELVEQGKMELLFKQDTLAFDRKQRCFYKKGL